MIKRCLALWLVVLTCPVFGAPELTDAQREQLAAGTTDNDDVLDQQSGLYVLLRNAARWQEGDFDGEAGAATAPPPDYDYIRQNPEKVRGNVYTIDGWVMLHDRYPSKENHKREKLYNTLDDAWGKQVTRWTIVTKKKDPSSTIIVLFTDPDGKIVEPKARTQVRVAARFYKLWTIPDQEGRPFTYPVFVGGATEVVKESERSSEGSPMNFILICIIVVTGAFFVIRHFLNRGGGGNLTKERLEEIRLKRERLEEEGGFEEDDADLPEDPVEALGALRQRHESD